MFSSRSPYCVMGIVTKNILFTLYISISKRTYYTGPLTPYMLKTRHNRDTLASLYATFIFIYMFLGLNHENQYPSVAAQCCNVMLLCSGFISTPSHYTLTWLPPPTPLPLFFLPVPFIPIPLPQMIAISVTTTILTIQKNIKNDLVSLHLTPNNLR